MSRNAEGRDDGLLELRVAAGLQHSAVTHYDAVEIVSEQPAIRGD